MKSILPLVCLLSGIFFSASAQVVHINGPAGSESFGQSVVCFADGNFAVTDPMYDENGKEDIGAVFIYDGKTLEVIATLKGKTSNDRIGSSIFLLNDNRLFVVSPFWGNGKGAITLLDNKVNSPVEVNESTSLVGVQTSDIGTLSLQVLPDKDYVIRIPGWNNNRGAVIAKSAVDPLTGTITRETAFTGTDAGDRIGQSVLVLNDKKIVMASSAYNQNRGAVTVLDFAACKGEVTNANSLVGERPDDQVGLRITPLKNNTGAVVNSYNWNNERGAVTFVDTRAPVTGYISSSNSLTGANSGDRVGNNGVYALSNHHYVVVSSLWNQHKGAVTWADGTKGITGLVNAANSLVGGRSGDQIGPELVELANGHYVIRSPNWNDGRGAVTWGDGQRGTVGEVNEHNSLVGSIVNELSGSRTVALPSGGYAVISSSIKGAVTWGNGESGTIGNVSVQNSLVGVAPEGSVGTVSITRLTNGNVVVSSPGWNKNRGAVTFVGAGRPVTGEISAQNSFVGTNDFDKIGDGGVIALTNGNYVFSSPGWGNRKGAVTWGKGNEGSTGEVSEDNSLVGIVTSGVFSPLTMYPLTNGNYVAHTLPQYEGDGIVVWGNGSTGTTGTVNASNSLSGENMTILSVLPLTNGNYVINSIKKFAEYNAITWANGQAPVTGTITENNSLINLYDGTGLGTSLPPFIPLTTGDYLVYNRFSHNGNGVATWVDGTKGMTGQPTDQNSILGESPEDGGNMIPVFNYPLKYLLVGRPVKNKVSVLNPHYEVVTGTEELLANTDKTTIYPNPTVEDVYLKLNHGTAEEVYVKIIDQKGYMVSFQNGTLSKEGILQISSQNLASGMYIVEITGKSFVERKKLMKH